MVLKATIHLGPSKKGIEKLRSVIQGHSSIKIVLDTYPHVLPGVREAVARRFGYLVESSAVEAADVGKGD